MAFLAACWFLQNQASVQADDSIPYFSADETNNYWVSEKKVAPRYPSRALRKNEQGCAAIGYIVESDGTTSTHRVIASYPSSLFDDSSIKAAKQFTYVPTENNSERQPIYTTNTFTFQLSIISYKDWHKKIHHG